MPGQWGNAEELLATMIEVLGDFRNVYIKSRPRKKGTAAPNTTPIKIPRPKGRDGQDRDRPKPATAGELAKFLGAQGVQIDYTPALEEGR